jgi:protease-4
MGRLSTIWRLAGTWCGAAVVLGVLGLVLGSTVFFLVYPGKPKVGIIDIPFTVITDSSAFEISALIDHARRERSVKAVVISLSTPGGGAAPSEHLYFAIKELREEKPVIMVMNDLVASGGYMMALGTNYTYAKPSTFMGGIGVILAPLPPLIPFPPTEQEVFTGPFKLEGGSRRHYVALTDQLRQSFGNLVLLERGDKLTMSLGEVMQGLIYAGVEGVRLGLVDAIGGEREAIEKAASLAGISSYGLVDINAEVSREFNQKLKRINEPLESAGAGLRLADLSALASQLATADDSARLLRDLGRSGSLLGTEALRTLPPPGGIGEAAEDALPDIPWKIRGPNVYYLYVGPSE